MTTLDYLLVNYTLEEEYIIHECECKCSKINRYNVSTFEHDVILDRKSVV